ncbi:hypothetical protein PRZ48_006722 [Zasmidium cellare]|uniref:Uncharacterized protein n=1 Tax=Zasmidium cellare TaxID=395010 RepID=A0ABR0EPK3_ZASCE|nr:hypothetical protein PRZ48_006722 [Zasmidium cellare]
MTNDSKDSTELNEIRTSIDKSSIKDLDNFNQEQAAYFADFAGKDEEWVEYRNKKLLRKVDAHLLPLLVLMYLMNFLDRNNLSQARQGTLEADLGMKGTDFNLATSIFFIGYLLMQLPSNMIITRVRPSLYLAAATTRIVDSADIPKIIEGTITIAIGLCAGFLLPDYPANTRWLGEEERAFAAWRLLRDINETDETRSSSVWDGIKMALKDYRLYLFTLLQHMNLLSQTFQYFFPSIVATLGFGNIETLLLTVPGKQISEVCGGEHTNKRPVWFATFLTSVIVTFTAAKTKDRSIHIIVLMLVAAIGNAIATATTSLGARFFAMFLMPMGAISAFTIIVPWIANSFPRPMVKRSACVAIANMIGNTASAYGSYMYPSSAAPQYIPGGSANAAISVCVALMALLLRVLHQRENKKLEIAEQEAAQSGEAAETQDRRGLGFRYVY